MSALVVDTSSWITYFRKGDERIDEALQAGVVFLSPVIVAELISGLSDPAQKAGMVDFLTGLPLCETGLDHWIRTGELRSRLFRKSLSVSTPDAHIAQCCLDINGRLLSEDKVFEKIARFHPLRLVRKLT